MVRLNEEEDREIIEQAAELMRAERRPVSKAEVLRRRAWNSVQVVDRAAA
jgi:hypothetical protein